MERRQLKEFVTFVPGINQSRAEKQFGAQKINYYDQSSFDADYNHKEGFVEPISNGFSEDSLSLSEGDIVISNSLQLATMVGQNNVGKVLSLNFIKVDFVSDELDKRYFLYLFNTYKDVQRQKEKELQGMGPILRIPLRSLGQIAIPLVPVVEQAKIGMIYTETLKLQSKLHKYAELMEQFTSTILEKSLKGDVKP